MSDADKDLAKLYRDRLRDRMQSKTKRRRQVDSSPRSVGDLLGSFFKSDTEAMRRLEESRALQAWESLVGPGASRVSQAIRFRSGTLTVRVNDPLWMQQLSLLKYDLLKKYKENFPKLGIRDIFFTRY